MNGPFVTAYFVPICGIDFEDLKSIFQMFSQSQVQAVSLKLSQVVIKVLQVDDHLK